MSGQSWADYPKYVDPGETLEWQINGDFWYVKQGENLKITVFNQACTGAQKGDGGNYDKRFDRVVVKNNTSYRQLVNLVIGFGKFDRKDVTGTIYAVTGLLDAEGNTYHDDRITEAVNLAISSADEITVSGGDAVTTLSGQNDIGRMLPFEGGYIAVHADIRNRVKILDSNLNQLNEITGLAYQIDMLLPQSTNDYYRYFDAYTQEVSGAWTRRTFDASTFTFFDDAETLPLGIKPFSVTFNRAGQRYISKLKDSSNFLLEKPDGTELTINWTFASVAKHGVLTEDESAIAYTANSGGTTTLFSIADGTNLGASPVQFSVFFSMRAFYALDNLAIGAQQDFGAIYYGFDYTWKGLGFVTVGNCAPLQILNQDAIRKLSANVTLSQVGDRLVKVEGEVIKAILELYAAKVGGSVPNDYLDYIYAIKGAGLNVASGNESFKRVGQADNFSLLSPAGLSITFSKRLLS